MTTLFVNRLTVIDFSYLHAERGLVGESWALDITLEGSLDEQGMVLDFADVKKQVKALVDDAFDHKLILPGSSPGLTQQAKGDFIEIGFAFSDDKKIIHGSPADALCVIAADEVNEETLSKAIINALREKMPANVSSLAIELRAEETDAPFYHYSHGLKHHCGNCQRIAHGHRSRIIIERNGIRDKVLEAEWAERWRDIYIGSTEDLVDDSDGIHRYRYSASQGPFYLELPADCCYDIDTDSTVENLAQHIAEELAKMRPESSIRVRAFEGIDKGAIGFSG